MKTIELTKGYKTIVDDDDFEYLCKQKWHVKICGRSHYACGKKWNTSTQTSTNIKMHRTILGVTDPKIIVDHADGDGLNNIRSNIRICTRSENQANRMIKYGSSMYRGVSWDKRAEKWHCYIGWERKMIHLGSFDNEIDAAKRYNQEAEKLFKEFAVFNDV